MYERNKKSVLNHLDNIHPLVRAFFQIRMIDFVKQIAILYLKNNLFKRNSALGLKLLILLRIPSEIFHRIPFWSNVSLLATLSVIPI